MAKKITNRDLVDIEMDMISMEKIICKPDWNKPKIGTIIDEEKSVRCNREEVDRLREKFDNEVKALCTQKNKKRDDLQNETYIVIQNEVKGISLNKAKKIWNYAYAEGHAAGWSHVFSILREVCDLVDEVLNGKD